MMSLSFAIVAGLLMGIVFGQMQLRNLVTLKVFLATVATGMLVLAALHGTDIITLYPTAAL